MKTGWPYSAEYQGGALLAAQRARDPQAESKAIYALTHKSHMPKARSLEQAFYERVAYGITDCWHWIGSRSEIGYGMFAASRDSYGCPEIVAHRISWFLHFGAIPEGMKVLHECDVRACVNPEHLFLGSQADNVADMVAKGRNRNVPKLGEDNPGSKLKAAQVREMRDLYAAGGISQYELARRYGVAVMTINRAVRGITWSDK